MEKSLSSGIENFRKEVVSSAEETIFTIFPTKILELQKLISSINDPESPFNISRGAETDATVYPPPSSNEPPSKKRKTSEDTSGNSGISDNDTQNARLENLVVANKRVKSVHEIIKKQCQELAFSIDKVKLWLTISLPKIEDGDNFGVQVQEEVLGELHRAQESAYNLRDVARQDYLARAKICSKLIKYPFVEDYTLALQEHDEKQLYYASQRLYDIRNLYAAVMDITQKNINKLRAPKGNNSSGLY
ncbi:proteasome activator pa28, REG alpha/beta subunit [Dendrothele bispora CBS 962.96]|uniref:Proteasome activator pa28, REG alpha/beta subunit n=1 Tax=Dendrothele bispora (strain CBS 962.96) TaxID=1314807 RepID=A0A4S8MWB2_DENBC|nr:proteasome activator pa28, REG alpha/beta subunit [Dendrothele bispora CBS 962.96]